MSELVDLPPVILQKIQQAADAAAGSAKLHKTEAGLRLTSIEARLVGIEGLLSSMYTEQRSHTSLLMQIADTQSKHTARFDGTNPRFHSINQHFDRIDETLLKILAKLP